MRNRLVLPLATLALVCAAAPRPARASNYIRVTIQPGVLLADGISNALVTAEVRGSSGRPARDGTEVRFYTTAGTITQVAFTSAGIARATLVSSRIAQAANVSVSVGIDQTVTTVPMVSKLVEANVGGRVMKVTGKYVAYSEDKHYIQADQQVRVKFRGVEIEANSLQVDVDQDRLVALGKVQIASGDKTLVGERLWLDLKSCEGYIVAVGLKQWFSAYGLTELPEKPKNVTASFDLVDLTDSKLMWVSSNAAYVIDERVQMAGARAFVGGIKSIRMPYHEANLGVGFGQDAQYVGVDSGGLTLDLPIYVRMSPDSSTAVRLGYGSQTGGLANFSENRGLSVDLVQKYGFAGASEGQAAITNMSDPSRLGFWWNHTQQFNPTTRLVTSLQFPEHRDVYGLMNLTAGMPIGTVQLGLSANKNSYGPLGTSLQFGYETKPKQLANNKLAISGEATYFRRTQQTVAYSPTPDSPDALRYTLKPVEYQTVGIKAVPASAQLGHGFSLDSSVALRAIMGTAGTAASGSGLGFSPGLETQLRKQLPNGGMASAGVTYNRLTQLTDVFPDEGAWQANLSATYPITSRLRLAALASKSLDARSQHTITQLSYNFTQKLRLDLLHTFFTFGPLHDSDYQIGLSQEIAGRDFAIYWSAREHRWLFQYGASRF